MRSFIVISRATGRAVFETFSACRACYVDPNHFEVIEAGRYLGELNRRIAEEKEV